MSATSLSPDKPRTADNMEDQLPGLLVSAHGIAAGVTLQLAVSHLLRWRGRRHDRVVLWFGLSSAALTAGLLANLWLIKASVDSREAVTDVRSLLLLSIIVIQVPTVAAFADRPIPRRALAALTTLCAIRFGLWLTTDLVYRHEFGPDGAPLYGPLVGATALPIIAVLLLVVFDLSRHWQDGVEGIAFSSGLVASLAVYVLSLTTDNGPLAELLTGLLFAPWIVALQVIGARRGAIRERAARRLVRQREEVSEELVRSERRSTMALRAGGMGWYEWDPDTRALAASPEFAELLGITAGEIPPTIDAVLDYVHDEDRAGIAAAIEGTPRSGHEAEDFRIIRADGVTLWIEANGRTVEGPHGRPEVLGVVRDVTERKRAERELTHLATHDPLTGLANRSALTTCMREYLGRGEQFALLLMDLNGFKDVNDTLGHPVGDEVLVAVARRLESVLRTTDVLTRIGGDEFALIVNDRADTAERVGHQVLAVLDDPVQVGGVAITVHASVGIVQAPDDGADADTLLRRVDAAMYRAKSRGGGIHSYAEDDDLSAARRLQLAGQLEAAIASGQIELHFQPTIAIASGECLTLEALARWRHPELGLVSPVEFIPLAEHYGLGPALARQVLNDALATCAAWRATGLAESVAVNISPKTLLERGFVGHVAKALAFARVPGDALTLELTEDSFADDTEELLGALNELRGLGVRLAIDDFGTGYSSLAYLERIPAHALKLDRVFAAGLSSDGANDAIVALSVELAHRLGFTVVAEGVESLDALDALERYGCDFAQGYAICRPAPSDVITPWLVENRSRNLRMD